ncbi:hypothetical protein P175DRAFT_0501406 [Aspergillus ochraceoroseus IBT 24754]|uniref:Uncharacterized protein n=1 Tax=Aspergillus ochraceoroseus IBT 24754 TaxID=1392256 RepID=A0A2T5LWX2_9EURO|nr:uncharacterized protein P175DRAFT_0501406 [Aspergillus ochraceoroseus IBT 24754]PTU20770.1 hypothetical protein P175DRAFT_0501406 [Aspergillus ochraceoroseus IBT 24754]
MSSPTVDGPSRRSLSRSAHPLVSQFGGPSPQDPAGRGAHDHYSDMFPNFGQRIEEDESDKDPTYISSDEDTPGSLNGHDGSNYGSLTETRRVSATSKTRGYPEDSSSPPQQRPNRFHRPAKTWLKLTREDRRIVGELEEAYAGDLAAQLYHAHIIQLEKRASVGATDEIQPKKDKPTDAASEEYESDASRSLDSIEEWAAWPMPGDEVPRPNEHFRRTKDDMFIFRMNPDPHPGAELEESIITSMLRTAKENFRSRSSSSPTPSSNAEYAESDTSDETSYADEQSASDIARIIHNDRALLRAVLKDNPSVSGSSTSGSDTDDDSSTEIRLRKNSEYITVPQRPVVQADDDISRHQLRPLARNIIAQVEELLVGIHYAQEDSDVPENSSNSENDSDSESLASRSSLPMGMGTSRSSRASSEGEVGTDTESLSSSITRNTTRYPDRDRSRGRKRARQSSSSPTAKSRSSRFSSDRTSTAAGSRSVSADSNSGPRLFDWKDMLAIASRVGLPPAVIMRTTQRCVALFDEAATPELADENVAERKSKFPGKNSDANEWPCSLSASGENVPHAQPLSKPVDDGNMAHDSIALARGRFVCPIKTCARSKHGFLRQWNLNQHMKTMHPGRVSKN